MQRSPKNRDVLVLKQLQIASNLVDTLYHKLVLIGVLIEKFFLYIGGETLLDLPLP